MFYLELNKGIKYFWEKDNVIIAYQGKFIKLNQTASKIFELCIEEKLSINEVIKILSNYYKNEFSKVLKQDTITLINRLLSLGIISEYSKWKIPYDYKVSGSNKIIYNKTKLEGLSMGNNFPTVCKFELTYRCNLKCIHCFIPHYFRAQKELTKKQIKEFLMELHHCGGREILFTGGEIFTRVDVLEIIKLAASFGFEIAISTNGTLLSTQMIKFLKNVNIKQINISVYGDEESYEKITMVKGSYKIMIRNIKEFIDNGVNIALRYILMKPNKDSLKKFVLSEEKLLNSPFIKFKISSGVIEPMKNGDISKTELSLEPKEVLKLKEEYRDIIKKEEPVKNKNFAHSLCIAGRKGFSISPNGKVYPCLSFSNSNFECGDISKEKFSTIWNNSSKLLQFRKIKREDIRECIDCINRPFCLPCLARNYQDTGNILKCSYRHKKIIEMLRGES